VTADSLGLVEVGPRLTLNPIKILEGSFGGPVLYSNPTYVSPNLVSLSNLGKLPCSSIYGRRWHCVHLRARMSRLASSRRCWAAG